MFNKYYQLTKPGLIYGNLVSTIAGFLLASGRNFDFFLFLAAIVGISLVIAAGCVFNNVFDTDIDNRMERTRNRALVTNTISKTNAMIFGSILGILGVTVLFMFTNSLAGFASVFGFIFYVFLYTPIKKRSVFGTLVGSIAGAVPPLVGYLAFRDKLDLGAILLFLILVCWQMPHFYSIAIYRLKDYAAAAVPVLPVKKGIWITKINIIGFIIAFVLATVALAWFKFAGILYLIVVLILGLVWFISALRGFTKNIDDSVWARKMFFLSLIILVIFSLTVSIDSLIR